MSRTAAIAALLALGLATGSARAQLIVMDQIGPNGTLTSGQSIVHSQTLEPGSAQFSDSAVDNFTLATATPITQVEAVMGAFAGGTLASFSNVTDWRVAVYSSKAAAIASQTGDVADIHVAPGSVTVAGGFNTSANSALVSVPLALNLNAGTYFLALIPRLDLAGNGQVGVYLSTFGGTPGDSNGFLANPGGGGGFPGNVLNLNSNLAYRVTAVPEAPQWSLIALSLGFFAACRYLRQRGEAA